MLPYEGQRRKPVGASSGLGCPVTLVTTVLARVTHCVSLRGGESLAGRGADGASGITMTMDLI